MIYYDVAYAKIDNSKLILQKNLLTIVIIIERYISFNFSQRSNLWRGRWSHILSPGQGGLHYVLHVRRWEETPHALPIEPRLQLQRERLRLAGKRRRLYPPHSSTATEQVNHGVAIDICETCIIISHT